MSSRRALLSTLCMLGHKESRIPSEFQKGKHLESTGTQNIDSGFISNQDTSVEFEEPEELHKGE